MEPELIQLSPLFIRLLRVGATAAYALRPCFAARLEVYSASTGHEGGWVPCALLISQRGEMYLFCADDGRVINAALLSASAETTNGKARIDVVTQSMLDAETDTQSVYIRCRNQLQLMNNFGEGEGGGPAAAVSDKMPGAFFPPFSYMVRFHCRSAPVLLQFLRTVTKFANPKNGEFTLRRVRLSLKGELNPSVFIDPLVPVPRQQEKGQQQRDTHKWTNALSKVSPLKLLSLLPGARNAVYMREIAKFEKKRLLDAGERIEFPLQVDPGLVLKPCFQYELDGAHAGSDEAAAQHRPGDMEDQGAMQNASPPLGGDSFGAVLPAVSHFYGWVMDKMPHFTLPSAEDVLGAYGLPVFEAQFAVLFVKPNIQNLVEKCVERLLASFPGLPNLPQYRIIAREAVREELRWNFGVAYRELCNTTRARIEDTSAEKLVLEEERATMQRSHDMAVKALLAESEARWQEMVEEEEHVFFDDNHEPKSVKTGQLLAPLCVEETGWRNEVVEIAEALEALELGIRRIRNTMAADSDDDDDDDDDDCDTKKESFGGKLGAVAVVSSNGGNGNTSGRFSSVKEEAAFLLQEIQKERETLLSVQLRCTGGDRGAKDIVEDDAELKSMRLEYNARILQQQRQIDMLKEELQRTTAPFGIKARWIQEQNRRPALAYEALDSPYIV